MLEIKSQSVQHAKLFSKHLLTWYILLISLVILLNDSFQVHSIYLISEGNSSDSAREILRDNIVKTRLASSTPIPIHVVSLFCQNNDTEIFLRSISQSANGKYELIKYQKRMIKILFFSIVIFHLKSKMKSLISKFQQI